MQLLLCEHDAQLGSIASANAEAADLALNVVFISTVGLYNKPGGRPPTRSGSWFCASAG